MGDRYRKIVENLGHRVGGEDVDTFLGFSRANADAIIVATPTSTHAQVLYDLRDCGRPILCEKPITKDVDYLDDLIWSFKKAGTRLSMVNQYAELDDPASEGMTAYNCTRHGDDGLFWDCISLIRLARGPIELREDSDVWQCTLNGRQLCLDDVRAAYATMIDRWLKDPTKTDYGDLLEAHRKVADLEAKCRVS